MKKALFIGIISVLLAIILFAFCSNTMKTPAEKVDFDILNISDATKEDFEKYNCAFAGENVEFVVENYRLLKVTYKISNNNDFSIKLFNEHSIKNNDFYLVEDCIDLEPTYPISANSSLDVDIYVYINNDLTDKNDILNKLYDLNIDFSFMT